MGETVSAVPSVLTGWAAWAQAHNPTLTSAARRADAAIQAFNNSKPDPAVVTRPVPYPGENVVSFAARNGIVDQWVGKVGEAFFAIATKNIPPEALQYESSYYSNRRISADESAVEQQVGGDPVAQAKAAGDAAEMHEAIDRSDGSTVRRMADGLAPYVQNGDGAYLLAYYKDLGPDYTVKATHFMDNLNDPAQAATLKTFDQGLVTATNQPGWDSSFDDRVFAEGTDDHPADPHRFLLLHDASAPHAPSYSTHFLEKAGDAYFFQYMNAPKLPDTVVIGSEPTNWVLNAISLNHQAAADWLTGRPPGEENEGTTRLWLLISSPGGQGGSLQMFHNAGAVNNLIAAAGNPDSGKSEELMKLFAHSPPQMVANAFKPGIAKAVGENIPLLLNGNKEDVDNILRFATLNPDGSANDDAALEIAKGAGKYLGTQVNSRELTDKNLYDIAGQAQKILDYLHEDLSGIEEDSKKAAELRSTIMFGALDLVPIPGLGEGAKELADAGKSVAIRAYEFYKSQHGGDAPDAKTNLALSIESAVATRYVALHPDLVGPGQDPTEVAAQLATGQQPPGEKDQKDMYSFLLFQKTFHGE